MPIVFGTDGGVLPHGQNAREFGALVSAAMLTPVEAVLRQGAVADIIAVAGNPLDDPDALSRVTFVMRHGRILKAAH